MMSPALVLCGGNSIGCITLTISALLFTTACGSALALCAALWVWQQHESILVVGILCSASCCLAQLVCISFPGEGVRRQHSSFWSDSRLPTHFPFFPFQPYYFPSAFGGIFFFLYLSPLMAKGGSNQWWKYHFLIFWHLGHFLFHPTALLGISDLQGNSKYRCRSEWFCSPGGHVVKECCLALLEWNPDCLLEWLEQWRDSVCKRHYNSHSTLLFAPEWQWSFRYSLHCLFWGCCMI